MSRINRRLAVTKIAADGTRDTRAGTVEVEEPLEIRAGGEQVAHLFRTPGHDIELAHGLLLAEGIITTAEDVATARYCQGAVGGENTYNLLDVELRSRTPLFIDPIPSHACGITSQQRIRELAAHLPIPDAPMSLDPPSIFALPSQLRRERNLPTAAASGVVRQDVDPLNAVHKIAGHMLIDAPSPAPGTPLVVDCRVTFAMVRAAAAAGFGAVVTTADATSMAVDLAREVNLVLIGEVTPERFSVYSGVHSSD